MYSPSYYKSNKEGALSTETLDKLERTGIALGPYKVY